tara:strand:- start:8829 stop:9725 length:897 start_codon:yes stop_codon:yes gene_type:complete
MTKYFSLTETFFKEIPFKDFINSISDDTPLNNFDSNQEYYKSRYDNFFQLTNISETELKQVINSFKTKFIEDNGSFDEKVFRNSYSFGINKFIDEIQDHLNTLSKGKAYTIERCKNKFIHHFELTLDVTSGKTIIISTKNIDQIHLYFKTIKQIIEKTIIEEFDKSKSVSRDNELRGFKIEDFYKISKFRNKLIEFDFIDKEITLKDFREIFDGEKFTKKIIWKKPLNHLRSLIKLMFEENIILDDEEKKWVITAMSFSLLIKEEIKEFDSNKVRTANKLSNKAEDVIRNVLKLSELL